MTLLKPALVAAAIAFASPVLADGFTATPVMPNLTFPSEAAFAPATRNPTRLLEACTIAPDDTGACTKAVEDVSSGVKTSRDE